MRNHRTITAASIALFGIPALHPALISYIGVPSHLLWWVHVLPVAMLAYYGGWRAAAVSIGASIVLLVGGERTFGSGYGVAATWDTTVSLATALGGTHILVAGFALFARVSTARFRALFDGAPIGLLAVAANGVIDAANAAAVRTLGVPAAKLRGTTLNALLGQGALPGGTAETAIVPDATVRYKRPDGGDVEIEIVRVDAPDAAAVQLAIRDVTVRNSMEARLRQTQKMQALGELAGGVAHDFNNILSVIGSVTDILLAESGPIAAQRSDDLMTIRSAVDRGAGIVRQLLTFGRRDVAASSVVSVAEVVAAMEPMICRLAGSGINVNISADTSQAIVRANRTHLEQIVLNLVTNARDAMPHGGDLSVDVRSSASRDRPAVILRISDTGFGIDDGIRSRLFDPYFTTKSPERGTGLGLATVHSLVRRYGGDIEVRSSPGSGATFIVRLPQATTQPSASGGSPIASVASALTPPLIRKDRILAAAAVS